MTLFSHPSRIYLKYTVDCPRKVGVVLDLVVYSCQVKLPGIRFQVSSHLESRTNQGLPKKQANAHPLIPQDQHPGQARSTYKNNEN